MARLVGEPLGTLHPLAVDSLNQLRPTHDAHRRKTVVTAEK